MDSLRKIWMRTDCGVNSAQAGQERRIIGHTAKGSVAREPLHKAFCGEFGRDTNGVRWTLRSESSGGGGGGST